MSELHCPARFLICSDTTTPEASAALARERVALRVDEAPTDEDGLTGLLDDLTDRYRGECVALILPAGLLASLTPEVTTSGPDRDVTVLP